MPSSSINKAVGNSRPNAVATAHATEALQQPIIATPVLLLGPCSTIKPMTRMNASAHPR
jgi:hypothetical protein